MRIWSPLWDPPRLDSFHTFPHRDAVWSSFMKCYPRPACIRSFERWCATMLCSVVVDFVFKIFIPSTELVVMGQYLRLQTVKDSCFNNVIFMSMLFCADFFSSFFRQSIYVCSAKEDEVILWMTNELNPFYSDSVVWGTCQFSTAGYTLKMKKKITLNEWIFFSSSAAKLCFIQKRERGKGKKKCSFVVDEITSSNIYKGTIRRKKEYYSPICKWSHRQQTKIIQVLWVGNQPANQPTNPVNLQRNLTENLHLESFFFFFLSSVR